MKAGNMHQFGHIRRQEIHELIPLISKHKEADTILLGDFNFKDVENERNEELDNNFVDVWVQLQPSKPGFTYDLELNPMAKSISDVVSSVKGTIGSSSRFDRVLLHKNNLCLQPGKPLTSCCWLAA